MRLAISTGSLACRSVALETGKQPLYIQLSCVIQGKPSEKKQRTGNIKITQKIYCLMLYCFLTNAKQSTAIHVQEGRVSKGLGGQKEGREGYQVEFKQWHCKKCTVLFSICIYLINIDISQFYLQYQMFFFNLKQLSAILICLSGHFMNYNNSMFKPQQSLFFLCMLFDFAAEKGWW